VGTSARHRAPLTVVIAFVLAACGDASPTPTPPASGAPEHSTGVDVPSGEPSASAAPPVAFEPPDPEPTGSQLIRDAVDAGELDPETGLLYRLYALMGDGRLPEEYRGEWTEDSVTLRILLDNLDKLSSETRAAVLPYLVRPNDPTSHWSTAPATGSVRLAQQQTGQPPCVDGWAHVVVTPQIPVMIWVRCSGEVADPYGKLEEIRGYMEELYGPMTTLMGPPIGDENVQGDLFADTPENGDGLIDIYIVGATSMATPRRIYNVHLGSAFDAPPYIGATDAEASSGYLVVTPAVAAGPKSLKSTLAHEFFHILQSAHNENGTIDCPPATNPCREDQLARHWFTEASATWSEHNFVPEARVIAPYRWFYRFLGSAWSLTDTQDGNAYASWMWPLFMEQERGAQSIADAWIGMESQRGWANIQAAVGAQVPFASRFRDFALRAWNERLAGDPIQTRYTDAQLDPQFPELIPRGLRIADEIVIDLGANKQHAVIDEITSLWSIYEPFRLAGGIGQVELDFTDMTDQADLAVDVLVNRLDGWELARLATGTNRLCVDDASDLIVVLSSHSSDPNALVSGIWSIEALEAPCSAVTGSISYLSVFDGPMGMEGTETDSVTVNVALEPSDEGFGRFVNEGSGVSASRITHAEGAADVTGCRITTNGESRPPANNLPPDAITGGQSPDATEFTISVGIPITTEIETNYCALGVDRQVVETAITFDCVGFLSPSTTAGRRYIFDCEQVLPGWTYSVQGSVVVTTP